MLYLLPVVLGAFLLFQVQPLIARQLLPYFGGGAAIWTACMLFFQVLLLAGYAYAHGLSKLRLRHQLQSHCFVLLLSAVALPIGLPAGFTPSASTPLLQLVSALAMSVGIPYLLLATTGPLLQQWFAQQHPRQTPYFLYSWSNAASLLALLSFPFLIEPNLSNSWQNHSWSLLYLLYLLLLCGLMLTLWRQLPTIAMEQSALQQMQIKQQHTDANQDGAAAVGAGFWLVYSELGVVFLVAITNAMTQNVAPIPFLWVVPLAIYLLTYIVAFQSTRWYQRGYAVWLLGILALIAVMMHFIGTQFDLLSQLVMYLGLLTVGCFICHAELANAKPGNSQLTRFYLMLALGGCIGSALVVFVASWLFDQFLEFPLAFIALLLTLACQQWRLSVVNAASGCYRSLSNWWQSTARRESLLALFFALLSSGLLLELNRLFTATDVYRSRNFYGVLSVKDVSINGVTERRLIDGSTSHGTQYLAVAGEHNKTQPLSYYRPGTGVAHALATLSTQKGALKVGFIGLGAGTLSAYGKPGDQYRFYELNPAVLQVAQQYFSFLADSAATISLVEGDARVSLHQELQQGQRQHFDLLVIDAFAGDSIPQHLLTLEAMTLYRQHLASDGIIAVHISNTHLNLLPLMVGTADKMGWQLGYFFSPATKQHPHQTEWVWLTANSLWLQSPATEALLSRVDLAGRSPLQWHDHYSDLLSLLK